jgi:two-component system response regulator HydG
MTPTLLLVDDDPAILDVVGRFARGAGFDAVPCDGGAAALDYLGTRRADVALVDLRMPDVDGLDVVRAIRETDPSCQVVLMSGAATIDSAVEAAKLGAIDYLTKPFDFARLRTLLGTIRDETTRRRRVLAIEQEAIRTVEFHGMVGRTARMQHLFSLIRRLAPHVRTVLVTGETGVGKELVAQALHACGPRSRGRFVAVNCSAVTETLFESQFFGQVKGAFTGAVDTATGVFESADRGTLFLDEVGELPLSGQAKLLRVLETGEIRRVGASASRQVDVHVVAATNRDLRSEVEAGRFRADLFYRLTVAEIDVPPLRNRREDIPYLTAAFIRHIAPRIGKTLVGTTPGAERRLLEAPWRGNVRELRNVIERGCILATGEFVTERELSGVEGAALLAPRLPSGAASAPSADPAALAELERQHILGVLQRTGGNKMSAARILGMSRRALYRRLERYGISSN